MTKPSERIKELYNLIKDPNDSEMRDAEKVIGVIMQYLDEEWEKKQQQYTRMVQVNKD